MGGGGEGGSLGPAVKRTFRNRLVSELGAPANHFIRSDPVCKEGSQCSC